MSKQKNAKGATVNLPESVAECHKLILEQNAIIDELNRDNASKEDQLQATLKAGAQSGVLPSFKNNGKVYQMLSPKFLLKDGDGHPKEFTAADVVKSTELQDRLIKMKSGVLEEVK